AEHAGRDRLTGRDRGDVGDAAVADEAEELAHEARIRTAVAAVGPGDHLDRVGAAGSGMPRLPDVDLLAAAVTHVLDAAGVPDHRVVPPVIRGEVALLVRGEHPVAQ